MTSDELPHPFGGGIPFPWHRDEGRALHQALKTHVKTHGQIEMLLQSACQGVEVPNSQLSPADMWREGLTALACVDGVLELCRQLADGTIVQVAQAARSVLGARPALTRRNAGDGRLVLDRTSLRGHLGKLGNPQSTLRVLLVKGDAKTGKTWSKYLFARAAEDGGADLLCLDSGTVATVEEAAASILGRFGVTDLPAGDTTDAAWHRKVCWSLSSLAADRGRPLWIAVDDLGPGPDGVTPLMDREVLAFFNQLVLQFNDLVMPKWFRLLLIHYPDDPVPTRWDQDVWTEERTDPTSVTAQDVADVLREWAADHGRNLHADDLVSAAAGVVTRADAPTAEDAGGGRPRLCRLHDEVRRELEQLESTLGRT